MEGTRRGDEVIVGGNARQQLHDARAYGRPLEGNEVALAPVEAAHLLLRGDLAAVDGRDLAGFLADVEPDVPDLLPRLLVYAEFRARGFYLSPARPDRVPEPRDGVDFVVYPRGEGPGSDAVAHRVRVVPEHAEVRVGDLAGHLAAVVDEEGEVTFLSVAAGTIEGSSGFDPPRTTGVLLADRVLLPEPPPALYRRGFYGQPVAGRDDAGDRDEGGGPIHLSLVEATYLARRGALSLAGDGAAESAPETGEHGDAAALVERGRTLAGERFDRRLRAYAALRDRGAVPKTGFKFGADFRVYADVEDVSDLGHSPWLVRVLPADRAVDPRELALDVRLAHGVRKRMVFALVDGDEVSWRSVERVTP